MAGDRRIGVRSVSEGNCPQIATFLIHTRLQPGVKATHANRLTVFNGFPRPSTPNRNA